jgi:hypothetical protein
LLSKELKAEECDVRPASRSDGQEEDNSITEGDNIIKKASILEALNFIGLIA